MSNLRGLADLLNSQGRDILGDRRESSSARIGPRLLDAVVEWHTADPAVGLKLPEDSARPEAFDCSAEQFSGVLSGEVLDEPRPIVDFVLFGVDLDALEIRLVELWSVVDLFVIYETPRTLKATPKPMFYQLVKNSPRFRRYRNKILHIAATEKDIATFTKARRGYTARRTRDTKAAWVMYKSLGTEIVKQFSAILRTNITLRSRFVDDATWATQNDADELPSRHALLHVKHCEIKADMTNLYLPTFSFKKNFHHLQRENRPV